MIISNIGGISMSLPHFSPDSMTRQSTYNSSIASQVKLISIANTGARVLVGTLADIISPVATHLPTGALIFPRKPVISRFAFLFAAAVLLLLTFIWMEVGVQNEGNLWALRCVYFILCSFCMQDLWLFSFQYWDWCQLQHCLYCFVSDRITHRLSKKSWLYLGQASSHHYGAYKI